MTEKKETIGDMPVYPIERFPAPWGGTTLHPGLTQRDWMASQALSGIMSNPDFWPIVSRGGLSMADVANTAYEAADAMIAARVRESAI